MDRNIQRQLFEYGDRVAIMDGPFAGLEGVYQMRNGEARGLILIDLLGKPQKLAIAVEALRRVSRQPVLN
jgi:transcriptional antiterminator RfaH